MLLKEDDRWTQDSCSNAVGIAHDDRLPKASRGFPGSVLVFFDTRWDSDDQGG